MRRSSVSGETPRRSLAGHLRRLIVAGRGEEGDTPAEHGEARGARSDGRGDEPRSEHGNVNRETGKGGSHAYFEVQMEAVGSLGLGVERWMGDFLAGPATSNGLRGCCNLGLIKRWAVLCFQILITKLDRPIIIF